MTQELIERVARAIAEASDYDLNYSDCKKYARAAIEASDQSQSARIAELQMLAKAVRSFQNADTEFQRANNTREQPRLQNAGNRYQTAKWRMFNAVRNSLTKDSTSG